MSIQLNLPGSNWRDCPTWDSLRQSLLDSGKISKTESKIYDKFFALSSELCNSRPCPEGVSSQILAGAAKKLPTTQDDLPLTSKSSADWIQAKHALQTDGEQIASLTFIMDCWPSFLPLIHNHLFFDNTSACSSLDFALRIFSPDVDMSNWHLRECVTHAGAHGRTYSESRLWDESGNIVVCMTQPPTAAKL